MTVRHLISLVSLEKMNSDDDDEAMGHKSAVLEPEDISVPDPQ